MKWGIELYVTAGGLFCTIDGCSLAGGGSVPFVGCGGECERLLVGDGELNHTRGLGCKVIVRIVTGIVTVVT